MDPWIRALEAGDTQAAWDLFVERHRRLMFAAIRHYTSDHDEVMDVFAQACAALRADDCAKLRRYLSQSDHRARFTTWLVTVIRNLTVDWFRHRDGRRRLSTVAADLPPLQRRIFELVFSEGRSHVETFEALQNVAEPALTFRAFLRELRATYQAVAARRKGPLMLELGGRLPPEVETAPDDATARREQEAALAEAMQSLPTEERLAIQLFVVEDLPAEEVARAVGFPNAKAVYNRVYRALDVLRSRLERAGITGVDL